MAKALINEVKPAVPKIIACLLVKLSVKTGDIIKAGQDIAVIEAMKMENNLCATNDGVVLTVPVAEGETLTAGQLIVEFE